MINLVKKITLSTAITLVSISYAQETINLSTNNVLTFEGGGVLGIAYSGLLYAYQESQGGQETNPIKNVKAVGGASAGSIAALMVGLGYSPNEINDVLSSTDFKQFEDGCSWWQFSCLKDNVNYYGYYSTDVLQTWLDSIVEQKTGSVNSTLLDIYNQTGVDLNFVVTDLAQGLPVVFSSSDPATQNIQASYVVRSSASIPGFFTAAFYEQQGDALVPAASPSDGSAFVDGGVADNYPIELMMQKYPNDNVIGFMLLDPTKMNWIVNGTMPTASTNLSNKIYPGAFYQYAMSLLGSVTNGQYTAMVKNDNILSRSVLINVGTLSFIDFSLTTEQQNTLKCSGYTAMQAALNKPAVSCASINFTTEQTIGQDFNNEEVTNTNLRNKFEPDVNSSYYQLLEKSAD